MRRTILRKLIAGPSWARSFQAVKTVLAGLVDDGLVERVAPPGGRARNMVQLTEAGRRTALRPAEAPGVAATVPPGAPNPGLTAGMRTPVHHNSTGD